MQTASSNTANSKQQAALQTTSRPGCCSLQAAPALDKAVKKAWHAQAKAAVAAGEFKRFRKVLVLMRRRLPSAAKCARWAKVLAMGPRPNRLKSEIDRVSAWRCKLEESVRDQMFLEALSSAGLVQWTPEEQEVIGNGPGANLVWKACGLTRGAVAECWDFLREHIRTIEVDWRTSDGIRATKIPPASLPPGGEAWLQYLACCYNRIWRVWAAMEASTRLEVLYYLKPNREIVDSIRFAEE